MVFNDVKEWVWGMLSHDCKKKELIPSDNDNCHNPCVGYLCTGCNNKFSITVRGIKGTIDANSERGELLKTALNTSEGRVILGETLTKSPNSAIKDLFKNMEQGKYKSIFIDGKLVEVFYLPGKFPVRPFKEVKIRKSGGEEFDGYITDANGITSYMQYWRVHHGDKLRRCLVCQ